MKGNIVRYRYSGFKYVSNTSWSYFCFWIDYSWIIRTRVFIIEGTADRWLSILKIDKSDIRMHIHPGMDILQQKCWPVDFKGKSMRFQNQILKDVYPAVSIIQEIGIIRSANVMRDSNFCIFRKPCVRGYKSKMLE